MISLYWTTLSSNDFSQPNYFDLMLITKSLILAEEDVNGKLLKEVQYIEEYTDSDVGVPLSVCELAVYKHWGKGTEYSITIHNKEFTVSDLHRYMNRVLSRLTEVVTEISKKYSLEIIFKPTEVRKQGGELTI